GGEEEGWPSGSDRGEDRGMGGWPKARVRRLQRSLQRLPRGCPPAAHRVPWFVTRAAEKARARAITNEEPHMKRMLVILMIAVAGLVAACGGSTSSPSVESLPAPASAAPASAAPASPASAAPASAAPAASPPAS